MSSAQSNIELQSMENPSEGSFSSNCGHNVSRARVTLIFEGKRNVSICSSSLDLDMSDTRSIPRNHIALVEDGNRTSFSSLTFAMLERPRS